MQPNFVRYVVNCYQYFYGSVFQFVSSSLVENLQVDC